MTMAEHVSYVGEIRYTYKVLVGNPEWRSPLEDLRGNWRLLLKGF
jgi:hypothetical protein